MNHRLVFVYYASPRYACELALSRILPKIDYFSKFLSHNSDVFPVSIILSIGLFFVEVHYRAL